MWNADILAIISTLLMVPVIIGIAWWAFSPRRKKRFDDAANLPFADEKKSKRDSGPSDAEPDEQETSGQADDSGDGTNKRN